MQLEILALRHQLAVCQHSVRRPRLRPTDRVLLARLARLWPGWRKALLIVQPRAVIARQRRRFRSRHISAEGVLTWGNPELDSGMSTYGTTALSVIGAITFLGY